MNRLVIALATLLALTPVAALAQEVPYCTATAQTQVSIPAPDTGSAVPDYVTLDIAGQ